MSEDMGFLVWFSVHNAAKPLAVPLREAHELFTSYGLDTSRLPHTLFPINAFQTASAATTVSYDDDITGDRVVLEAVEVRQNETVHERHVIRRSRNPKTKLVTSARLISLKFYYARRTQSGRDPDGHNVEHYLEPSLAEGGIGQKAGRTYPVSEQDKIMAQRWLDDFSAEYDLLQSHIRADAIRTLLRDYLLKLDGLLVNPKGGVYFIPAQHGEQLQSIRSFVKSVCETAPLHIITLSSTPAHRAMLQECWQDTARSALERINARITAEFAGPPTQVKLASVRLQWNTFRAQLAGLEIRLLTYALIDGSTQKTVKAMLEPTRSRLESLGEEFGYR